MLSRMRPEFSPLSTFKVGFPKVNGGVMNRWVRAPNDQLEYLSIALLDFEKGKSPDLKFKGGCRVQIVETCCVRSTRSRPLNPLE